MDAATDFFNVSSIIMDGIGGLLFVCLASSGIILANENHPRSGFFGV